MADNNYDEQQIKKMKDKFGSKNVEKAQQIEKALREGTPNDFVMQNLTSQQAATLQKVLSDKTAIEKIMASEQAQKLLKKLMEDK